MRNLGKDLQYQKTLNFSVWPEERGLCLDLQTTAAGSHEMTFMLIVSSRLFLRLLALLLASLACYSSLALSFGYSCYSSSYCLSWPLYSVSHPPSTDLALLPSQAFLLEALTIVFIFQGTSINSPSCFLISTKFLTCSFPQSLAVLCTPLSYSRTFLIPHHASTLFTLSYAPSAHGFNLSWSTSSLFQLVWV